jgi:hypothetical protein
MVAQKKVFEFCGNLREVPARSTPEVFRLLTTPTCSGLFVLILDLPTEARAITLVGFDFRPRMGKGVGWAFQIEFRDFARKPPMRSAPPKTPEI